MKKQIILTALYCFIALTPIKPAFAQEANKSIKIGVIDINMIIRDATAFKAMREQIAKYREVFQAEIQKEEEALRTANEELTRQRTLLSSEAFSEKRRDFEKRVAEVQRLVQQRKQNLDRAQGAAMKEIQKSLQEVIATFASEQDISLVFRKDQTVLTSKALLITKVVLERLNSVIPTIKVAPPVK